MRINLRSLLGGLVIVLALAIAAGTVRGFADDAVAKPGGVVIKPTGKRVRVVSVLPGRDSRASVAVATQASALQGQVLVRPALLSLAATTAPRVAQPSLEVGLEFGEQSVRLPLGYDPRENAYYGGGPVVHFPYFDGYSYPSSCYSGPTYGYGGFGYGSGYGSRSIYSRRGLWSACGR